ncbi:hypothetical protein FRC03_009018 [Tulasnella sp. 419]|nr:hypothetical protein FRC03_009018 [Tulasnella sp. 419]
MSSPSPSIKAKEKQRWRDKLLLSSPKAKEFGDEVSGALVTTLTIVEKSLDGVPVPGLKTAVGGILEIIKAIKKSKSNAEDMDQLSKHLETLMESVINPVKDAKMTDALEARINRLTTDLQQIQLNHEGMSKKGRVRQFLAVHDHADTILGLDRMLNRALQTFMGGGVVQIERRIENVYDAVTATGNDTQAVLDVVSGTGRVIEQHILTQAEQDLLKGLPYVSARYDCVSRTGASTCLENTRTALLEHIFEWIQDSRAAQKIFWLHGLAGTGKSTIAHTVARNLDDKGRLGASFFFSRDEVDRRSPLRVLPTIAHQLAQAMQRYLCRWISS